METSHCEQSQHHKEAADETTDSRTSVRSRLSDFKSSNRSDSVRFRQISDFKSSITSVSFRFLQFCK